MRLHNSLSKQQHIFSFSYDAFDEILSQDTDCHISLHQYFTFCLYEILLQSTCIHTIRISFWNFHRNVFQHLSHDNIHTHTHLQWHESTAMQTNALLRKYAYTERDIQRERQRDEKERGNRTIFPKHVITLHICWVDLLILFHENAPHFCTTYSLDKSILISISTCVLVIN